MSVVGETAVVNGNLDSIVNDLEVDNCSKSVEVGLLKMAAEERSDGSTDVLIGLVSVADNVVSGNVVDLADSAFGCIVGSILAEPSDVSEASYVVAVSVVIALVVVSDEVVRVTSVVDIVVNVPSCELSVVNVVMEVIAEFVVSAPPTEFD